MSELQWKRGMDPVDFSCFDNDLLMDEDGDVRSRATPYFKAKEMADGVWQILSDGDYSYLLEGDDELILIDAGNGAGNIREFCQDIRPDKPLYRLLNTHFHIDHTTCNYLFDAVYMSPKTYFCRLDPGYKAIGVPDDYPIVFINDGDVINLKGRPLEVYAIDEHCPGSLQFLDRKSRILFCGDELNGNFFDSRISVEHSYRNLRRWESFRDAYDTLAAGNGIHEASFVEKYLEMAEYIMNGHPDAGEEFYVPSMDLQSPITEKDGKPVHERRSPNLDAFYQPLVDAGYKKALEMNDDKVCFCLLRKLTPDGMFDRQYEKDGVRFCYYQNRIWDVEESRKYDSLIFPIHQGQIMADQLK